MIQEAIVKQLLNSGFSLSIIEVLGDVHVIALKDGHIKASYTLREFLDTKKLTKAASTMQSQVSALCKGNGDSAL